jgi:hypothetical protein
VRVLGQEVVTRYHIRFTEEETARLRADGMLPPAGSACADMYVSGDELEIICRRLGVRFAVPS